MAYDQKRNQTEIDFTHQGLLVRGTPFRGGAGELLVVDVLRRVTTDGNLLFLDNVVADVSGGLGVVHADRVTS